MNSSVQWFYFNSFIQHLKIKQIFHEFSHSQCSPIIDSNAFTFSKPSKEKNMYILSNFSPSQNEKLKNFGKPSHTDQALELMYASISSSSFSLQGATSFSFLPAPPAPPPPPLPPLPPALPLKGDFLGPVSLLP